MTEDIAEDIEPDTLREVELLQARDLLGALVGQKVTAVRVEDNRIAIEAENGVSYFFYGFMGEELPDEADEA